MPDMGSSALTTKALLNGRMLEGWRRVVLANELRTMRAGNMVMVFCETG